MSISFGEGDVLLVIRPPILRRIVSIAAILGIAGVLIWGAVSSSGQAAIWRVALVCGAGLMGWLALHFYRATSVALELTRTELRVSNGLVLCQLADVQKVERGAFAFKPSNGLGLVTGSKNAFAWQPGLWWRMGHRLGIGGATSAAQARALAETITLIKKEPTDGGEDPQPQ